MSIHETLKYLHISLNLANFQFVFLLYLAAGKRRYGLDPINPHSRKKWAFQITTKGTCSLMVREHGALREERLTGPLLVATAPDCVHGWSGQPEDTCGVLVFQFDEADQALRSLLGQDGWRSLRLSPSQLRAVQKLHDRCAEAHRRDTLSSPVVFRIAASELSLLVLESVPQAEHGVAADSEAKKVALALAWYEANLQLAPSVQDAAEAVHVSASHLRRLFHKIRRISPQAAFTRVQFERATEWMHDPAMTLENIAASSGFCSASAFSHAFKAAFGMSPKAYRANL